MGGSMRKATAVAVVVVLVAGVVAALQAQGRGGRPAAGVSKVERVTVHGKALEGNLEGDSPDRDVTVYLPPELCGRPGPPLSGGLPAAWLRRPRGHLHRRLARLPESADRLAAAPGFSEPIVVTPDAFTLHKGSMYSNSPTTGDWEQFVAEDLVAYVDSHYRTLAARMSRGLAGHSMGGYGAVRIGMKRPDVFSSLSMSACCLTRQPRPRPEAMAAAEAIRRASRPRQRRAPGFGPRSAWRRRGLVAQSGQPAAVPRPPGEGRQGAARHRRQVGRQRATRDGRAVRRRPECATTRWPSISAPGQPARGRTASCTRR